MSDYTELKQQLRERFAYGTDPYVAADAIDSLESAVAARDAQIAELREEVERERMRLAVCGVVAMADTHDSAAKCRDVHGDYKSASLSDVMRTVDAMMACREQVAALKADNERLRKDAERYRWLRDPNNAIADVALRIVDYDAVELAAGDELDSGIDAAIAKSAT